MVDYESPFDNNFSVDKLSPFSNERFETSSKFDKKSRSIRSWYLKLNCNLRLITVSKTDKVHRFETSFEKKEINKSYNRLINDNNRLIINKLYFGNTLSSFIAEQFKTCNCSSRFFIAYGRYETTRKSAKKLTATRYQKL